MERFQAIAARFHRMPSEGWTRWLAALLFYSGTAFGFWAPPQPAQARDAPPTLMVASQLPLTPGHESTLEIRVTPESAIPPRALIVIKGTPTGVTVSERRAIGPGVWVVPATHLTILKLIAAKDYGGGGVITIALATLDGNAIAEAMVALVSGPQAGVPVYAPAGPPTGTITASPPPAPSERGLNPQPKMTTKNRSELLLLLEKGMESLRVGNMLGSSSSVPRRTDRRRRRWRLPRPTTPRSLAGWLR
jgi:hypothetical protein